MNDTQNPPAPADAQTVPASAITPTEIPIPTSPAPASATSAAAPAPASSGNVRKDAAGVPFDAARHLEKMHPHSGRWMPRAQKGVKKRLASSAGTFSGSSPGANSNVSSPAPVSFIPATPPADPDAEEVDRGGSPAADARAELVDRSDAAGEVGARAVPFVAGLVLKAPEDCVATPAEHRELAKAVSDYVRAKGWQASAGIALALMFGAWLLKVLSKPRPMATVSGWFAPSAPASASKAAPASAPKPDEPRAPASPSSSGLPPGIPPLASS